MKVIYAGFPNSGTHGNSQLLPELFNVLGYKNYDFMESYLHLSAEWTRIFLVGGSKEDFRRMFKDVDSCTGYPACYFWEEIHEAFPEAKVGGAAAAVVVDVVVVVVSEALLL